MTPFVQAKRLSAAARLILVAGAVLFGSRALASCGEYVHVGTHSSPATVQFSERASSISPERLTEQTPILPRRPCSGPGCSQQPPQTPSVPAPPSSPPSSELWGWLASAPHIFHAGAMERLDDNAHFILALHPFRLERPPRFAV